MGIACAGQTRETIAELLLVTKLIFESPTSLGRELPIGSAFSEGKVENFVQDILFTYKLVWVTPVLGKWDLNFLEFDERRKSLFDRRKEV